MKGLRLSLPLMVGMLMLALAAFGVSAQGETVSAMGTFHAEQQNPGGYELSMSGQIQLTFYRSGGSAVGTLAAEIVRSGDGLVLEHFFNLALEGSFEGFPGGQIGGGMSGLFTDKYIADQLYELQLLICAFDDSGSDPDCADPAPDYEAHTLEVSGSWQGNLDRGGSGSGTFEIDVPAYSLGENHFQAMQISGSWEISGIPMGGTSQAAATSIEDFIPGAIPLLHKTTLPTTQIPAMAILGVLGALAGLWLSQALAEATGLGIEASAPDRAMRQKPGKSGVELVWGDRAQAPADSAPADQANSPVDGRLVPVEQARHEQALLDAGYRYDPENDAFVYDPEKMEALKADPSSSMSQALRDEIERAERARDERIRQQTAWQERDQQEHMSEIERFETAIMALKTAEFLANAGVSNAAHFVPVAGPVIETAYAEINRIASSETAADAEEPMADLQETTDRPFYKAFRERFKTPAESSSHRVLVVMLDPTLDVDRQVETGIGFDAIIERGTQLITGNP